MEYSHELIMPNDDIPLSCSFLRGRTGIMSGKSTGIGQWSCLRFLRADWISTSMTCAVL